MTSHGRDNTQFVLILAGILAVAGPTVAQPLPAANYTAAKITAMVATAAGASDADNADGQRQVEELRQRLGMTEGAIVALLRILGQANVPYEELTQKLSELAGQYREVVSRVSELEPDDPTAQQAVRNAQTAVSDGRLSAGDQLLGEAEQIEIVAFNTSRAPEPAAQQQRIRAAQTMGARGEIAMVQLNYLDAAERFQSAITWLPDGRPTEQVGLLNRKADALVHAGQENGDNTALLNAVPCYRLALEKQDRESDPRAWAAIQRNLAAALRAIGERAADTSALREAVAGYRTALEETTRERMPLEWAANQHDLGDALLKLAEREGTTARLDEAAAALRAALAERTRDRVPVDWAASQNRLGNVLQAMGRRDGDTARLEAAAAAYDAALLEMGPERGLSQWSLIEINRGTVLFELGRRTQNGRQVADALRGFRQSKIIYERIGRTAEVAAVTPMIAEAEQLLAQLPHPVVVAAATSADIDLPGTEPTVTALSRAPVASQSDPAPFREAQASPSGASQSGQPPASPAASRNLLQALVERGDAMLALGDVSAARLLYQRGAAGGSGRAATGVGKTYDPRFLAEIRASGFVGDPAAAAAWYEKAMALGDPTAAELLKRLGDRTNR